MKNAEISLLAALLALAIHAGGLIMLLAYINVRSAFGSLHLGLIHF